jgi:taurine dioxygenase
LRVEHRTGGGNVVEELDVTLDFRHLTPVVGVEVLSDPRRDLSSEEIDQLRALFDEFHVLVFRGYDLQDADQIRLCQYLDTVIEDSPGSIVGYLSNARGEGRDGTVEMKYHYDLAFCDHPLSGISLYAIALQNDLSSTYFCRVVDLSDWIADDLWSRAAGHEVINMYPHPGRNNVDVVPPNTPMKKRPLIGQHPRTGREMMYATYDYTDSVVGLEPSESDALLDDLFAAVYQPEHTYQHYWRMNDFVVWDNFAVHHARAEISPVGRRTLRRVVMGTATMEQQWPGYLAMSGGYGGAYIGDSGSEVNT